MSEERERKRKSKARERKTERKGRGKGKKDRVSHGPFLIPKVIVVVIVLLSFVIPVCVPFFWKLLQSSKKECSDYPGTFLVQNLTRICWHAITTTNNEMKKPKTLNSCRTTEIKNIGFQESGHRSFTEPTFNVVVFRFFSSYRFFEWKQKMAHGGSWKTKRIGAGFLQNPDMVLHAWAILGENVGKLDVSVYVYVCVYI